jgi:hypothetical protein
MKAFYVLRRANDGQCQIFDYATHQPIIEPGFDFSRTTCDGSSVQKFIVVYLEHQ